MGLQLPQEPETSRLAPHTSPFPVLQEAVLGTLLDACAFHLHALRAHLHP